MNEEKGNGFMTFVAFEEILRTDQELKLKDGFSKALPSGCHGTG